MKKVIDYQLTTNLVILIFEDNNGMTVSKRSVNNYLADIYSPMNLYQLCQIADKSKVLALLTEYFELKYTTELLGAAFNGLTRIIKLYDQNIPA